jgi:pilus assembly protein CpaE
MNTVILSDDQSAAERLRSALAACDVTCPIDRVLPLTAATGSGLTHAGELDVVFVMLSGDESSLTMLESLCGRGTVPIVAVGAARDPRFILRVVHAGPADYLDIDGDLDAELRRAISRLQPADRSPPVAGKLVSVLSHCGGSGCSLVAVNLAVTLAERHTECLLCDFNVRRGDLATFLNLKPTFTVNDVSVNRSRLQRDVFKQALTPHSSGVHLLAAPLAFADVRPIPADTMSEIVSLARRTFSYTVAELEDFFHPEQFEVLRQSDVVLFVMRLDYTALRNAVRTFEYLEREGIDVSVFRLVANQYGRPRELTPSQAREALGRPVDHLIPYDPKVAIEAMNRGCPIVQAAPRSTITRALRALADEVTEAVRTDPVAS